MKLKRFTAIMLMVWLTMAAVVLAPMTAQATVAEQTPYIAHTANGATATFAYPFRILKDTDLVVMVAGVQKTLTTDYTITGIGQSAGGTVVFNSAPVSGVAVEIQRDIPRDRTTDYQQAGPFFAKTVNSDMDRLAMQVQELGMGFDRAIKVRTPPGTVEDTVDSTEYANRAGKAFGYNTDGKLSLLATNLVTSAGTIANPWVDVRGYADIHAAVAAIGGTVTELKVVNYQTLASDLVIPENITLKVEPDGMINRNGKSLTINGPFSAGLHQVFAGTGTVSFGTGAVSEEYAEWYGGITPAITSISMREARLKISSTQSISSDTAIPVTLTLVKGENGLISVASGKTLTINSPFNAERKQFFTGSGTVKFARNAVVEVCPEWWTTNTSPGTTAMNTAVDSAVKSILDVGGTIRMDTYLLTGALSYSHNYDITFRGNGWNNTVITHSGNNACFSFQRTGSLIFARIMFDGVRIVGNSGASAIFAEYKDSVGSGAHNCYISGYSAGSAFQLKNYTGWTEFADFYNLVLRGNLNHFTFVRDNSGGGTDSFQGFTAKRIVTNKSKVIEQLPRKTGEKVANSPYCVVFN